MQCLGHTNISNSPIAGDTCLLSEPSVVLLFLLPVALDSSPGHAEVCSLFVTKPQGPCNAYGDLSRPALPSILTGR